MKLQHNKIDLSQYTNMMYDSVRKAGIFDEDMTSEIITTAIERINRTSSYDPARGSVSTWLPWVMRSVISNYCRNIKTSQDAMDQGTLPLDTIHNKIDESHDFLKEVLSVIKDAQLTKKEKFLLYLKWNVGLTSAEIGKKLDCPPVLIRKRYSRVIHKLKDEHEKGLSTINRNSHSRSTE